MISSRTTWRIQPNCSSNSGSVEKSHATVVPLSSSFGGCHRPLP
jgi:hypothetical protein